jgi:hypothetical protein
MKFKLAFLIPVLALLTGCSLGGNNNQAVNDLVRACELVNARENSDSFIPDVAVEFFASAARANSDYLPLVQAAKLGQLQLNAFSTIDQLDSEIIQARSLIIGYCTPRLAK